MNSVSVTAGNSPLILAQPHGGTHVPEEIWNRLNPTGQALADTDWHINRLYDGLLDGVTVVRSNIHRYVIDANRDPADHSLYPGQNTTSLCPITDFAGKPIYNTAQAPTADEIKDRQIMYHQPYHDALSREIIRLKQRFAQVILYDCHSIRSHLPFLFTGRLPDFNIGTYDGRACGAHIEKSVSERCAHAQGYTLTVNGRFKGGWTTRHYGQPDQGVHAIQMELAQSTYMHESPPWEYRPDKAGEIRQHLRQLLHNLDSIARR